MHGKPTSEFFDWDRYLETASYKQVMAGMEGKRKFVPTMFLPDGKLLYLASLDIACDVEDTDFLRFVLDELYDSLLLDIRFMKWSCENVYHREVDYFTVWSLLYNMNALPENYEHPAYYLRKAWQKAGLNQAVAASVGNSEQ